MNLIFLDTFFIVAWRITFEHSTCQTQVRGFTVVVSLLGEKSHSRRLMYSTVPKFASGLKVEGRFVQSTPRRRKSTVQLVVNLDTR